MRIPEHLKQGRSEYNRETAAFFAELSRIAYQQIELACSVYKSLGAKFAYPISVDNHQAFVLIFQNFTVIAFPGTQKDFEDILTDLDFAWSGFGFNPDYQIHTGFKKSAQALRRGIRDVMDHHDWYDKPVYFCGHSLGGAVAQICAYKVSCMHDLAPIIYSYGAPRICNRPLADVFERELVHHRVVNGSDIVPNLPLISMGFEHAEEKVIYLSSSGKIKIDPSTLGLLFDQWLDVAKGLVDGFRGKIPIRRFTRHRINEYCDRLEKSNG